MKRLLPKILAVLTQHNRDLVEVGVDFEWSATSWTHNVFRCYELVFGRRSGIKVEMGVYSDPHGNVWYTCYSWESAFALTEQYVRAWFASFKLVPFKVYIPILVTPQGIPVFASPYLFAVALDVNNGGFSAGSPNTVSFTCTGSNLLLLAAGSSTGAADPFTTYTYNGSNLTAVNTNFQFFSSNWAYHYYAIGPATGAHNLVLSCANSYVNALSYSGVSQSGFPDSVNTTSGSGSSMTVSTTVVASNCWITAFTPMIVDTESAGAGTTMRLPAGVDSGRSCADSNGTVGTGSKSLVVNGNISGNYYGSIVSIAPPSAATAKSITSDIIFFN